MNKKITKFENSVYKTIKKIPLGRISTYKDIALHLKTKGYRAIGNALNKNPFAPIVPCHRIIRSNGEVGGFASGTNNKIKILKKEGIKIKNNKVLNLEKVKYKL
jgi:methylated-DNA-[protein]-cysteine S-methyltransferase